MFTGIITRVGSIESVEERSGGRRIRCSFGSWDRALEAGESIAINGVCLTVTTFAEEAGRASVDFDVLTETLRVTTLGELVAGSEVNMERALCMGEPLGGHLVSGHVDGRGTVHSVTSVGPDWRVRVIVPEELRSDLVLKGSVGLNGVSLTLAAVHDDGFEVHLIPHTWEQTTLRLLEAESAVNLEMDPLAKLARKWITSGERPEAISWEQFREVGWGRPAAK